MKTKNKNSEKIKKGIISNTSLLVELFYFQDELHIFIVRSNFTRPEVISQPLPKRELDEMMENFLLGFQKNDLKARLKSTWMRLSKLICEPLKPYLQEQDRIIIVPYKLFHYFPLHLLPFDCKPLIEKHPIVYAPSASVLQYCQRKNPLRKDKRFRPQSIVSFGVDFEEESKIVSSYFNSSDVFLNSQSPIGKNIIKKACTNADIIHFSCHGIFDFDRPDRSGLVLKGYNDSSDKKPSFFTLEEIYNLELGSYLVTLGACNTALSMHRPGDDLVGLTRGFFYAGTPTVIASLWPVPNSPTIALMDSFYSNLIRQSMDKAEALQAAQMTIRNQFIDPLEWGGFIVVGDWL